MQFSEAMILLRAGKKVRRECWPGTTYLEISTTPCPLSDNKNPTQPTIYQFMDGDRWQIRLNYGAYTDDLFANDWDITTTESKFLPLPTQDQTKEG